MGSNEALTNGDVVPKSEKKKKNLEETPSRPKPEGDTKPELKTPKEKKEPKTPKQDGKTPKDVSTPGKTPKRTVKGGIQVEDLKEGIGEEVKQGKMVGMYYSGKLKSNNKTFDKCLEGKGFKFRVGKGEVIKGWDIGLLGMKVGGKRRLVIPPAMAYGPQGAPPDIPGNSTLVFEVECKFVK